MYNSRYISLGSWTGLPKNNMYPLNRQRGREGRIKLPQFYPAKHSELCSVENLVLFQVLTYAHPHGEAEWQESGKHQADPHLQNYTLSFSVNDCVECLSAKTFSESRQYSCTVGTVHLSQANNGKNSSPQTSPQYVDIPLPRSKNHHVCIDTQILNTLLCTLPLFCSP